MSLDPAICYRALRTRDSRFDGRFFTAVRSTGIYCRPVCPAPTPRRENCLFLPCAAAAQEAGYRPCLRCRPEAAPGTPAWCGTSASVARALRLIEEGALDGGSVGELAARVGVGERHLRRLFLEHIGAAPRTVAQTRRILFAKKLIDETDLPMTRAALAAGFSSVRRFNEAILRTYGRPPRTLRKRARPAPTPDGDSIELRLAYRPPYPWPALCAFFALRAIPGVESVKDGVYVRSIAMDDVLGRIEVHEEPEDRQLRVRLHLAGPAPLLRVAERLRHLLDLGADPDPIRETLAEDPALRPRLAALPGIRVPGAWDGFELAVRAVLGQQVSVAAATTLAGKLVERFGAPLPGTLADGAVTHRFPSAAELAGADLGALPIPGQRARALAALADAVASGKLSLDPSSDPVETARGLRALPGFGDWTAQYVAMRALRDPDAFPASDLGLRRALGFETRALEEASQRWRPWRAYAAVLLWLSEAH